MFTQCPECETIFKLSAEVLRAAAGEVRCGRCGEVFNALRSLAEDPGAFGTGDSPREQETRADNILRFVPPVSPARETAEEDFEHEGSPGTQIAHLEIQGIEEQLPWSGEERRSGESYTRTIADDPSMEFTLPPGELDRIFIEERPRSFEPADLSASANPHIEEFDPISPDQIDSGEAAPEPESGIGAPAASLAEAAPGAVDPDPQARDLPEYLQAPPRRATQDPSDGIESIVAAQSWPDAQPAPIHRGRWLAAAALFSLLLAAQFVHHNRDSLAQAAGIGAAVRSFYAITGHPIPLRMNLAAFEVRQWGVTGAAGAKGTLRVRASLINTGSDPQPYPLLRLTLADRFGARVGSRDFTPEEYLHKTPLRPLDPGERADAVVEILDPGKTAEGFEIDVCERSSDARILCANDAAARAK